MSLKIIILTSILLNCCQSLCPPLVLPKNADYSGNCRVRLWGSVCTVKCFPGYVRKGSSLRKCMFNRWSGIPTKCILKPKSCPPIRNLEKGLALNACVNRFTTGCVLQFRCNEGYQLKGNQTIECLRSGKWSAPKPKCKEKSKVPEKCNKLSTPLNGYWISKDYRNQCNGDPGQTCHLRCIAGTALVGPLFVYCDLETRKWSKPMPKCIYYPMRRPLINPRNLN